MMSQAVAAPVGPDPSMLLKRAGELVIAGRPGAAHPLLAALDRIGTDPVAVADLRAKLALNENRLDDAESCVDQAIAAWPGVAALHRRRAEVRTRLDRYGDAARDAAEAVLLDPTDAIARALLGATMLLLGHLPEACACLDDAVARAPANAPFREALADAQEQAGALDKAKRTLSDGIVLAPRARGLRNRLTQLHIREGAWQSALDVAEKARRDGAADAMLFGMTGCALTHLGRHSEASEAYAEALKLMPDDISLKNLLVVSGALARGGDAR